MIRNQELVEEMLTLTETLQVRPHQKGPARRQRGGEQRHRASRPAARSPTPPA